VSKHLRPALADLLAYLGEMGYGDLYLKSSRTVTPVMPVMPAAVPVAIAAVRRPPAPLPVLDEEGEARAGELAALAAVAATCTRCRLSEGRQKVVFGAGNPAAELMLIGEGPGAEEDRQGLPFVGAAGELLNKIIQAIEMTRGEVYIANVVKCRPPGNF